MSCILLFAFPLLFLGTTLIGAAIASGFSQNLKSYG
jgi:hypothetical protein